MFPPMTACSGDLLYTIFIQRSMSVSPNAIRMEARVRHTSIFVIDGFNLLVQPIKYLELIVISKGHRPVVW